MNIARLAKAKCKAFIVYNLIMNAISSSEVHQLNRMRDRICDKTHLRCSSDDCCLLLSACQMPDQIPK